MFVLFWALPFLDKLCLHSEKKKQKLVKIENSEESNLFNLFFGGYYIVTEHLMIGSCQPFENAHPKALQRDLRSWDEASGIHGQPVEKEEDGDTEEHEMGISTIPSLGAPGILRAYHGISETVSRSQRKNIIGLKDIFPF